MAALAERGYDLVVLSVNRCPGDLLFFGNTAFNRAKSLNKAAYQEVPIGAAFSFAFPETDAVRRSEAEEVGGRARVAARGVFRAVVHQPNLSVQE